MSNSNSKPGEFAIIKSPVGLNAEFIHMKLPQSDRIKRLNAIAIRQMQTLTVRTARQMEGRSE
jgi:hypothetical protein